MKILYFALSIFLFSYSCKSDAPSNDNHSIELPITEEQVKNDLPSFEIETAMDNQEIPISAISILVGDKKLELTKVNACEKIDRADYAQYQIPPEAIDACGGWWAGAGDYFYIIDNGNNNYTVMQGMMDEENTSDSYNYKMVMNLSNRPKPK